MSKIHGITFTPPTAGLVRPQNFGNNNHSNVGRIVGVPQSGDGWDYNVLGDTM